MQPDSTIEEVSMMSQMWKTGTLVAIALTATVAAQQPPPAAQQPPPTAPPAARADSSDKVVVTGCVQRGIQSPVGTTGAPGAPAAADASKFILTKASPASDATATPKTYRLDADDSQLTSHVGHKVEITGTVDAKPAPGDAASPAKLKVASVKMIAASCSE
jgi:hypothetical protein